MLVKAKRDAPKVKENKTKKKSTKVVIVNKHGFYVSGTQGYDKATVIIFFVNCFIIFFVSHCPRA